MEEREEISLGIAQGYSYRAIARSQSTISREVARDCTTAGYRAVSAQRKTTRRYTRKPRKLAISAHLRHHVIMGLKRQWSPAQISARRNATYPDDEKMRVSPETIYTYLYVLPRGALRRELLGYLRQHHKTRRPRSCGQDRRGQISDMISIEERPAEVADRTVPGHWIGASSWVQATARPWVPLWSAQSARPC